MKWIAGIVVACFAVGLLIGLSRGGGSDPEAVRLLRAAAQAPKHHDFTARAVTFASYGSEPIHTEAMVYNARGGPYRIEYRMGSLSGVIAGRTEDGVTWRFDPLERNMVAGRRNPEDPNIQRNMDLLLKNYLATVKDRKTIAGRPATEILLQPRGAGGTRSLWIDNETGVILRSEERNDGNELVAATQYASIQYGATASPDQFLPIPPGSEPVRWHAQEDFAKESTPEEIRKELGVQVVEPAYIPAGFTHEGHYIYRCPGCDTHAAVTRYVNGLDSITLIQSKPGCEEHLDRRSLDFGLGKAVFAENGAGCFWVMGELPKNELERVSQSLTASAKP